MNQLPAEDPPETLPSYRVELESIDGGIRRVNHVHADSAEDALLKAREADLWPSSGPGSDPARFRAVEVAVQDDTTEARQQRNARRRYLNTIVEAGLSALGETTPARSEHEFFDVLCDFFARSVVLPGHFAFPADPETDRLVNTHDDAIVLTRLLTNHLAHHGLDVTRPE